MNIFKQITVLLFLTGCFTSCAKSGSNDDESFSITKINENDPPYYWYRGEKITLQKMSGKFYVVFYSTNEEKFRDELEKKGISLDYVEEWADYSHTGFDMSGSGALKLIDFKTSFIEGSHEMCATALSYAQYWSPFYKTMDGSEIRITQLFTVILRSKADFPQLELLANENCVEMIGWDTNDCFSDWYLLACTNLSTGNALEMANLFYESKLFENAFPEIIANAQLDLMKQ